MEFEEEFKHSDGSGLFAFAEYLTKARKDFVTIEMIPVLGKVPELIYVAVDFVGNRNAHALNFNCDEDKFWDYLRSEIIRGDVLQIPYYLKKPLRRDNNDSALNSFVINLLERGFGVDKVEAEIKYHNSYVDVSYRSYYDRYLTGEATVSFRESSKYVEGYLMCEEKRAEEYGLEFKVTNA